MRKILLKVKRTSDIKINTSFEAEDIVEGEDNIEEININTSLEAKVLPVRVDVSLFDGGKESVGDLKIWNEINSNNVSV